MMLNKSKVTSFNLAKTLRIVAWVARFARNSRLMKQERMAGPLTTEEIQQQHLFWTKRAQQIQDVKVRDDQQRLGLKGNEQGILECQDRVQGHHPVYLPVHCKIRGRCPSLYLAWGSRFDNVAHPRALLGAEAQTSDQQGHKTVPWLSPLTSQSRT